MQFLSKYFKIYFLAFKPTEFHVLLSNCHSNKTWRLKNHLSFYLLPSSSFLTSCLPDTAYVCIMYICMCYVFMYVCVYVYVCVCMSMCIVWIYLCICVCVYVCMCMCFMCVCSWLGMCAHMSVLYEYICMYLCIYVCVLCACWNKKLLFPYKTSTDSFL